MHTFSENLAVEIPLYYKTLALQHGKVPKIFTMVKEDGHQFLFFLEDLEMDSAEESDFLKFIIQVEGAVSYARGGLFVQENEQQSIGVFIHDRADPQSIWCEANLTRDDEGKPKTVSDFGKQLAPRDKVTFGWLFDGLDLSEERLIEYGASWDAIKPKILNRQMQVPQS